MPSTSYYLTLKSHPDTEPTIAWAPGWREPSAVIKCTTAASPASAPHTVTRLGELDTAMFGVQWMHHDPAARFELGLLAVGTVAAEHAGWASAPAEAWDWSGAQVQLHATEPGLGAARRATVQGLAPGHTYFVKIRAVAAAAATAESDPVPFRTAAAGAVYTTMHRISEYAEDVDFLENHDSASPEAMPLYLMTCSPEGNCQPWNKTQFTKTDAEWDSCEVALANICPGHRGTGFNGCVECIDAHHDAVVAACGNYTDADKEHPGYPVHYYCGVGWPENLMYFSAITEYCVEHLQPEAPDSQWEGFAQYISCNSDETDAAWNNSARDPTCMCWVWDDRQMSMLTLADLDAKCGSHMPWYVHEPICNCTDSKSFPESTAIVATNPSSEYVGMMPTYLPWGYYQTPGGPYPVKKRRGENYSTPKKGSCKEGQTLSTDGCKWKRTPGARIIYGPDIFGAGWDDTWVPDTPENQTHTEYNIAAFARATHTNDHLMTQRCCGC